MCWRAKSFVLYTGQQPLYEATNMTTGAIMPVLGSGGIPILSHWKLSISVGAFEIENGF